MGSMRLLSALLDVLFPPRSTAHTMRRVSFDTLAPYIEPRLLTEHSVGLLPYRHPLVHAAIVESKFYADTHAHTVLGCVLAEYLQSAELGAFSAHAPVLVPIPLSKQRMRERGHNQSARITGEALHVLGTEFTSNARVLRRIRNTTPQTKLSRKERLINMQGAFTAQDIDPSTTYIVIDDVTTTGATLYAAREALLRAGATDVTCIALAY